jgi:CAAX protease family protein
MSLETPDTPLSNRQVVLRVGFFWAGYLAIIYSTGYLKSRVPPEWGGLFWGAASSVLILGLTVLFLRLDRRRPATIGVNVDRGSVLRLIAGVVIALVTYGLIVLLVATLLGPVRFVRVSGQQASVVFLTMVTTLALAAMEELGFRGYPLRTLVGAFGYWPAQVIVAVAFGLCHLLFGYSWLAIWLGVIPCALLFGAAAIASRGLAVPIGVHTGLNLAQWMAGERSGQGGIWSIVADEQTRARIGAYSPLIVVGVTLVAAVAIWIWGRSRANS